jgi:Zn-dependent peptidase ImmA (M78 family)/transcriptional regulator with XRE-family HTH domain
MPEARRFAVEPDVLVWARERLGLSQEQAADLLKLEPEELAAIERGDIEPKVSTLELAASKYHVSLFTLVAPKRPTSFKKPKDYRTVGGLAPAFSSATLQAIYETQYFRHAMRDLIDGLEEVGESPLPNLPRKTRNNDPAGAAAEARAALAITHQEQLAWPTADAAFGAWRWSVEQLGIFVHQRKLPRRDCRGFSFWDDNLPATIVLNSSETFQARQFTLFHEYAHLLLRMDAICNEREDVDERPLERWCNQFAAGVLMPADLVLEVARLYARDAFTSGRWRAEDVERIARRLKVGRPSMAIRLEELDLAPVGLAEALIPSWDAEWEEDVWTTQPEPEEEPRELRIPMATRRISALGVGMPELVFRGVDAGVIDQLDATHLLETGSKHFAAMREALAKKRETYA